MKTLIEGILIAVIAFILFLNIFAFMFALVKKDPMIQEECNSRIPSVMLMYHFGCYITGNTYSTR